MRKQRPPDPLITTKLNRPAVAGNWVERPRLLARLDEGLEGRVTLISAPAGSGKTTVAAQWLAHLSGPSAWLSLDEHDGEPDRFLRYVLAAIRTAVPGVGAGVAQLLTAVHLPPPAYLADALAADLAALRANPRNAGVAFNLGLLLAEEGKNTEAETALRAALKADPEMAPAAYNLCVLTSKDRLAEALTWCKKAVELRPSDARYGYTLGFYQQQQGDTGAAVQTPRRVIASHLPPTPTCCWGSSTRSRKTPRPRGACIGEQSRIRGSRSGIGWSSARSCRRCREPAIPDCTRR